MCEYKSYYQLLRAEIPPWGTVKDFSNLHQLISSSGNEQKRARVKDKKKKVQGINSNDPGSIALNALFSSISKNVYPVCQINAYLSLYINM